MHMVIDALGRALAPTGHGSSAIRKLGRKEDVLRALWARPEVVRALEEQIRQLARGADHVQTLIEAKIRGSATYRMIDAYPIDH